jgi:hypothetical protein
MSAAVQRAEMQQDMSALIDYAEKSNVEMLSKRTCYQTEKITKQYASLEMVPVDEKEVVSVEVGGKVMTPYSCLGTFHFSKTATVTTTATTGATKCPSKTECTVVTCMEDVNKPDNEFPIP